MEWWGVDGVESGERRMECGECKVESREWSVPS